MNVFDGCQAKVQGNVEVVKHERDEEDGPNLIGSHFRESEKYPNTEYHRYDHTGEK